MSHGVIFIHKKKFTNQYTTPRLGNAKYWATILQAKGYVVDKAPSVGSIAWYDGHTGPTSPNGAGPEGHVAFVDCIVGSVITLSEYNWNACSYGIRNIDLSSPSAPGNPGNRHPDLYIHTEVGGLGSASNNTTTTDIPFDFLVYPNPGSGNVTLKFNTITAASANLNVYNMMGQLILTQKVDANIDQVYLNLRNQPNGMYFIRLNQATFNVARKIIIAH
jgi:surface antigen